MILNRPLVALDTETTGQHPSYDRIVQIAVIKVYPDGGSKEWSTLLNPDMPIPREVVAVHGIDDTAVASAPRFKDVASALIKGLKDCDICAYNGDFDLRMLAAEFRRIPHPLPEWGVLVDPFKIFQMTQPRDLSAAVQHYLGEELVDAHNATADAKATLRVLLAQLERHPELPRDVASLSALLERPRTSSVIDKRGKLAWRNGEACINFGDKWAGHPLRSVPRDYLRWMLRKDFSDDVKAIVEKELRGEHLTRDE